MCCGSALSSCCRRAIRLPRWHSTRRSSSPVATEPLIRPRSSTAFSIAASANGCATNITRRRDFIRVPDMPAGQPFTRLCQKLARPRTAGRADLHIHSTYSDGRYTPAQIVELARRSGLSAIAITDHDTAAGLGAAQEAASEASPEVISGVEITAEHRSQELHLLGYFF